MSSKSLLDAFQKIGNRIEPSLTYTVGGDPNADISLEIFKSIANSGADIIECGLGHGANIGDGGAIQDGTPGLYQMVLKLMMSLKL